MRWSSGDKDGEAMRGKKDLVESRHDDKNRRVVVLEDQEIEGYDNNMYSSVGLLCCGGGKFIHLQDESSSIKEKMQNAQVAGELWLGKANQIRLEDSIGGCCF